jgi:hypothetical protein
MSGFYGVTCTLWKGVHRYVYPTTLEKDVDAPGLFSREVYTKYLPILWIVYLGGFVHLGRNLTGKVTISKL